MYTGSLHIASDHGGYKLKTRLIRYIENELEREVDDMGALEYDKTDDYPDYVVPLAKKVAEENSRGIVICKNGIGVNMVANKTNGVRCGIGYSLYAAESMRKDDNTNILALPSWHLSEDLAMAVVKTWLETEFSEAERHVRRLEKITDLEK